MKYWDFSLLIGHNFYALCDLVENNESPTPLWLWDFMQKASIIKEEIRNELDAYEMGLESVPYEFSDLDPSSCPREVSDLIEIENSFERAEGIIRSLEEHRIDSISWSLIVPLRDIVKCGRELVIKCRDQFDMALKKTKK